MGRIFVLFLIGLFSLNFIWSQQTARVKGVVLNEFEDPVTSVVVEVKGQNINAVTDHTGFYQLEIPSNKEVILIFSHVSYKNIELKLKLKPNQDYELNPVIKVNEVQLNGAVVIGTSKEVIEGVTVIEPQILRNISGANAGVENIIKTLPGVYSNNELSTSYSVRGGNFDENLVYVNDIQVYRPFLVRSGQQEGLSFTNTDMVEKVVFSAGGFQAKYGDKLSSVLDITYKQPKKNLTIFRGSFLGGSLTYQHGPSKKNTKLTGLIGARYRNNNLLVNTRETQADYTPSFIDVQTFLTYNQSKKWSWSFLGNISRNKYFFKPFTRKTTFGTITTPVAVIIDYEGQEDDRYSTYFGAIKSTYKKNDNNSIKFIASAYHTKEQEYYDILSSYGLGEIDTSIGSETFGDVNFVRGLGKQLNHARNKLDALILNYQTKGHHKFIFNDSLSSGQINWGVSLALENIRDRIYEWEVVDSAGFSLPGLDLDISNNQPYIPYLGPLEPYQSVIGTNNTNFYRSSGFLQYSHEDQLFDRKIWFNLGVRSQFWLVEDRINNQQENHFIVSPRGQFVIRPFLNNCLRLSKYQ